MSNLERSYARNGGGVASWKGLVTGATGAATVTLAHEVVRQLVPGAPRLDRLGMDALTKTMRALGLSAPRGERLRGYTLLADIAGNAMYYAPVASAGRRPWLRGLALGVAAGLGAVLLTPKLGLPRRHRGPHLKTQAMTVGLYALGGLAAGAMATFLGRNDGADLADRMRIAEGAEGSLA